MGFVIGSFLSLFNGNLQVWPLFQDSDIMPSDIAANMKCDRRANIWIYNLYGSVSIGINLMAALILISSMMTSDDSVLCVNFKIVNMQFRMTVIHRWSWFVMWLLLGQINLWFFNSSCITLGSDLWFESQSILYQCLSVQMEHMWRRNILAFWWHRRLWCDGN